MPRQPLPVDEILPSLVEALRSVGCAVLRAPTGAGKTTRTPQAILEANLASARAIVMLQPRRLAARAAARRIAFERGVRLGDEVGYEVRFDRKLTASTRIKVVSDGIFLRMLQEDPFLENVGAVIFDEFHERGLNVDLALAMAKRVRAEARPDLKLVVMSATLDVETASAFLDSCPILESQGRLFPVEIEYLDRPTSGPPQEWTARSIRRALETTIGDLLVFLPGVGEIHRTADELQGIADSNDLAVMKLYGDLPSEEQDAVLLPGPRRKVILSTNVAETSITVEGVTTVVDSGLARVLKYDAAVGLDRLNLTRISRASADQRSGRAGRLGPGKCFRLWTQAEQFQLVAAEDPEIRRVDLTGAVLELLCWGERDIFEFPWFESPSRPSVERALQLLRALDALDDRGVTDVGRRIARLPVHPRIGRLLTEGHRLGEVDRTCLLAAMLSERDPFVGARERRQSRHTSDSDTLDNLEVLEEFDDRGGRGFGGILNVGAARFVLRARDQLLRLVRQVCGKTPPLRMESDEAVLRSLLAGFLDRLARRREPGSKRGVMVGGRGVRLADSSAVAHGDLFLCIDLDAAGAEALVRQASQVERAWITGDCATGTELEFDAARQRVVAYRRTRFRDLVIDEAPTSTTDGEALASALAAAAMQDLEKAAPLNDREIRVFLARVRFLRRWMPDVEFPEFSETTMKDLLPGLCAGRKSFEELRRAPWLGAMRGLLSFEQSRLLDREAPERLEVPSGSKIHIDYDEDRPPVVAVRIQEVFGLAKTPRLAGGRVPIVLHLLAPNMRPQQVTDDLESFWTNIYPTVRKELSRRYPKHSWPEDPWTAEPQRRPTRKPK